MEVWAQELVPNGGFENYTSCPDLLGQLERATGWWHPTEGSTDLYNACDGASSTVGVPSNIEGFQPAHGGNGYAGIICFNGPENIAANDVHEYLSHALSTPLIPGETYTVSFYVSLSDLSKYAVASIGALFSMQQPHRNDFLAIADAPQFNSTGPALLGDTAGWTRLEGCFTADSAYAWITIGNFLAGASTVYGQVPQAWTGSFFSYYYVDDVSVRHLPRPHLGLGPELSICGPTILAVHDPTPGASYLWSTGQQGPAITVGTAGTYSVAVADATCPLRDSVEVHLGIPVGISLPADTAVDFCLTPAVRLDAELQPPGSTVAWNTGETAAGITVYQAGSYRIQAQAAGYCPASRTITITDACATPVYAPNAFTPNGDGINDHWQPVWAQNENTALTWEVFDRWGHVMFISSSINSAWDGTSQGEPAPMGIYAWRAHLMDPTTAAQHVLTGHILLIR